MSLSLRAAMLAALCAANVACAVEVQVTNPWARSASQGQAAAPAYLDIRSDTPLRLVGATSAWARRIEIRAVEFKQGATSERTVPALDVPAGTPFRLAPGGDYLALVGIERAFGNGDMVPITLRFEDARGIAHRVDLKAQVRGLVLLPLPPAKPE